ncbi:hypothetical protein ACXR6G_01990 [Ancylomarina sp. YFZ004]
MRIIMIISVLILCQFSIIAQNRVDIKSLLKTNGDLQFELQIENQPFQLETFHNWTQSTNHYISGEITRINSKEFIYTGKSRIYLSQKPSTFQTDILFTLHISKKNGGTHYVMKDIHYKSIPEYGKQGTPAIHTYCSDWFTHKKLYKKSGKMRTLNQNLMKNSTQFAEELILSFFK